MSIKQRFIEYRESDSKLIIIKKRLALLIKLSLENRAL